LGSLLVLYFSFLKKNKKNGKESSKGTPNRISQISQILPRNKTLLEKKKEREVQKIIFKIVSGIGAGFGIFGIFSITPQKSN